MVLVKVQYDAYDRQFKLLDRELAHALDDGENYLLIADLSGEDLSLTHGVVDRRSRNFTVAFGCQCAVREDDAADEHKDVL